MIDQTKLEATVSIGLDALQDVLKQEIPSKEQLSRARLGASVLSSATRYEATRNSLISLRFRVAQSMLSNKTAMRQYLMSSSPELKLLESRKEESIK